MAHSARCRITRGPALARTGVGRVAIGAQRAAVDPGVGDGIDDLVARATQHRGDHCGRGDSHENHVIQPDAIEAVLQREHALDLVRLDHRGEHVAHGERRLAFHHALARQVIRDGEDAAEIVGRVPPLGREPRVVEVEPANHRADVERRLHRLELERRARHARAARHHRPRHDGPEHLRAGGILQRLEAAGERIHQAITRGVVGLLAIDRRGVRVVRDRDENGVRIRPSGRLVVVARHGSGTLFDGNEGEIFGAQCSSRTAG